MHLIERSLLRICSKLVRALLLAAVWVASNASAGELVTYKGQVRSILKKHCAGCHNANRSRGGLDLSSYASIMRGSETGEVVVAGDAADSILYLAATHEAEPSMPPGGKKIPEKQLHVLMRWIEGGLLENESSKPTGVASRADSRGPDSSDAMTRGSLQDQAPHSLPDEKDLSIGPVYQGPHEAANKALAANARQELIAVGAQLQVLLFDAESCQLMGVLPFPEGEPQVLRFSADGTRLLAGGGVHAQSGSVVIWDVATGQRMWEGGDEFDVVMAADLSPDCKYVVLGGPERIIKVLSTVSDEVIHRIEKHSDCILDARFGADGLVFATADRDGGVYVWETESGELMHSLRGHKGGVHSIAFHADRDVCKTASDDGTIRSWDLHSGTQFERITAHAEGVLGITMNQLGATISIGRDKLCKTWQSSEAMISEQLTSLPISIASLADAKCVVSLYDGTHIRWDYSDNSMMRLEVPQELLTNNLTDLIPESFVAVRSNAETATTDDSTPVESDLLRMATALEQRLRQVNQRIPSITAQVGGLHRLIRELEADKSALEARLDDKLAELAAAEAQLQALVSELDQMFDIAE